MAGLIGIGCQDATSHARHERTWVARLRFTTEGDQVMTHEDRDTVVVTDSGSSTGLILGVLVVVIVLAGLWYFAMGPGAGGGTTQENNPDVNIEVPVEPPVEPPGS
jgi:hypothetical protein